MSTSVNNSFIQSFDPVFHAAYQKKMANARARVRVATGVVGETHTFEKIGTGIATTKTRHGNISPMNIDHTSVTATLKNRYAGDYVDTLDLNKLSIDEIEAISQARVGALSRALDDQIYTAMNDTTTTVAEGSAGLTYAKILAAWEKLQENNVDNADRFCAIGAHQWSELMNIDEFKSADYVRDLPFPDGAAVKNWLGINWYMDTGLPLDSGTRTCFMWHRLAVGWAEGQPFTYETTYHGEKAAWLVKGFYSGGAALIDAEGCVAIACDDDATITA